MLNHNKKYCINHSSCYVFAKGFCVQCYRQYYLYPKQKEKQKKIYKIKPYSKKRKILNIEYSRKKKEKWNQLIHEGKNKCYFTNVILDPNGPIPDFHHTLGRDGDLLCDMNYAFSCLFKPHRQYHDLQYTYDQLEQIDWYKSFLQRLEKENPILYHKEQMKIQKANTKVPRYVKIPTETNTDHINS